MNPRSEGGVETSLEHLLSPSDTFARRHLGSGAAEIGAMLDAVGVASLDELVDETIPRSIRRREPLRIDAASESTARGVLAELAARRTRCAVRSSAGLRRLPRARSHPAQHPREPGLVHAVHALPGGDLPGPARGAAQLPDHGRRPDRPAGGQRLAARRGDRRGRGHAHGARGGGRGPQEQARTLDLRGVARLPSADHRRGQDPRRSPRRRGRGSATAISATRLAGGDVFGVLLQYPATDGRMRDLSAAIARIRGAGAVAVVATDLLALTLLAVAGRVRRRRRGRLGAALRRADGLRRSARGVPRDPRRATSARSPAA